MLRVRDLEACGPISDPSPTIYLLPGFNLTETFFFLRLIFQNKNGTNIDTYLLAFLVRVKWNNVLKAVSPSPWWATLVLQGHGVDLFIFTGSEKIPQVFISCYYIFSSTSKSPQTPLPSHRHSFCIQNTYFPCSPFICYCIIDICT